MDSINGLYIIHTVTTEQPVLMGQFGILLFDPRVLCPYLAQTGEVTKRSTLLTLTIRCFSHQSPLHGISPNLFFATYNLSPL